MSGRRQTAEETAFAQAKPTDIPDSDRCCARMVELCLVSELH
jgi:hypothetical protein